MALLSDKRGRWKKLSPAESVELREKRERWRWRARRDEKKIEGGGEKQTTEKLMMVICVKG